MKYLVRTICTYEDGKVVKKEELGRIKAIADSVADELTLAADTDTADAVEYTKGSQRSRTITVWKEKTKKAKQEQDNPKKAKKPAAEKPKIEEETKK